jgi:hypothetical protein
MKSTPKGKVHEVFRTLLDGLVSQAQSIAQGLKQTGQRKWQTPTEWDGSPLDLASMTEPFDRGEIGTNYEELISDASAPGTVGDVASVKMQGDYVASMERAFRASRATPVRCLAHAAAARNGQGNSKGVFNGSILKYAEDCLQAGAQ